jgi:hypothetical protein
MNALNYLSETEEAVRKAAAYPCMEYPIFQSDALSFSAINFGNGVSIVTRDPEGVVTAEIADRVLRRMRMPVEQR